MKSDLSNLIIIGATPLIIYGVCKYYISPSNLNHNNNDSTLQQIDLSLNTINLNEINEQSHIDLSNNLIDEHITSPVISKKNSIISSRASSVVDLCDLESFKTNSNDNSNNFEEDDIHLVESKVDLKSNRNEYVFYDSYKIKRFFNKVISNFK